MLTTDIKLINLRYKDQVTAVLIEHALESSASIRNESRNISYRYVAVMTASQMDINRVTYVDYICGWNRYVMKILGIWPEERNVNQLSSYLVLLTISFMVLVITIPQTINLYIVRDDFGMIVENLSVANMTVMIAIFKTTAFWWNGRTLRILLSRMEEDRKEATSETGVRRMTNIAKLCRKISVGSIILTVTVVSFAILLRFWMNRYTGRMLIILSYYPYDSLITPNYELTIFGQAIAGCYSGGTYTVVDIFVATLVFHACGQFTNLKEKLHSLCSKGVNGSQSELAEIVRKHNSLYNFVETIENLFNDMLLIQMLGCTVLLCVQSFQAIVTITGQKLEILLPQMTFFGIYISYILCQLYLYCYIGEKLHSESMGIIEAAYETEWYNLSPNEARSIILIMIRARSPLHLTAGKFVSLNHELFSTILKTSMSYLSVLYAVKTKND